MINKHIKNPINKSNFLLHQYKRIFFFLLLSLLISCTLSKKNKPNIIIIYSDDQDFSEVGCYGGKVLTPNIDRIAKEGIKFNRMYVNSPVCTPSRFGIMTGKYAIHSKALRKKYPHGEPAFIRWNTNLMVGDTTIASLLKSAGYTTGFVGKWHLGDPKLDESAKDGNPEATEIKKILLENYNHVKQNIKQYGFDFVESVYSNNVMSYEMALPEELWAHNQEWLTKSAIEFITANKDNPFFLYFATTIPHEPDPLQSLQSDKYITPYGYIEPITDVQPSRVSVLKRTREAGIDDENAAITWLDDGIGAVLDKLEELGIRDKTFIVFMADNGGGRIERGKMACYETSSRVVAVASWKNRIPQNLVYNGLVENVDISATVLTIAGINPKIYNLSGISILPIIEGKEVEIREDVYLEVTYTRAVVTSEWKYIATRFPSYIQKKITPRNRRSFTQEGTPYVMDIPGKIKVLGNTDKYFPGYYDDDQLYYLKTDSLEQNNLAYNPQYKPVLEDMKRRLTKYSQRLPFPFGEFKRVKQ